MMRPRSLCLSMVIAVDLVGISHAQQFDAQWSARQSKKEIQDD